MNRTETLAAIKADPRVTVLIIGAGINGVGVLRDLALQDVDVLLVDRGDICSGTSAASGRVIHGGIRYLENGEFRLVRESVEERDRLLHNAPHTVKPLPTTIPLYSWSAGIVHAARRFLGLTSKPNDRGALIVKIGLMMFDAFSDGGKTLPRHRFFSRRTTLERFPKLNPSIVALTTYYDARIDAPERLCVELALDAEQDHSGARTLTYARVEGAEGARVRLCDELTRETVWVEPTIVVNASGAWIDLTNEAIGRPTRYIGGTKGSHLVLDHAELRAAVRDEMIFFTNQDGRTCIAYAIEDRVIAGTTDIAVSSPDEARCSPEEVAYILDTLRLIFPSIAVDRSHIAATFCGVRPLPRSDATTTGQISRDHLNAVQPPDARLPFPVMNLIGGKWTTYRAFSAQVTDAILAQSGRPRRADTRSTAIGGGVGYPAKGQHAAYVDRLAAQHGIARERAAALFDRYGTRAEAMAAFIAQAPDRPLAAMPGFSAREIEYVTRFEGVVHLEDLIFRRTLIGILGYSTRNLLEALAAIAAPALDWSPETTRAEIERTIAVLRDKHQQEID